MKKHFKLKKKHLKLGEVTMALAEVEAEVLIEVETVGDEEGATQTQGSSIMITRILNEEFNVITVRSTGMLKLNVGPRRRTLILLKNKR